MEISKMLTLSTAHITKETADKLDFEYEDSTYDEYCENSICFNGGFSLYRKDCFGWFIHIPHESMLDEPIIPDDLRDCFIFAKNNGCDWLCLDADGLIEKSLKTYEWEE